MVTHPPIKDDKKGCQVDQKGEYKPKTERKVCQTTKAGAKPDQGRMMERSARDLRLTTLWYGFSIAWKLASQGGT